MALEPRQQPLISSQSPHKGMHQHLSTPTSTTHSRAEIFLSSFPEAAYISMDICVWDLLCSTPPPDEPDYAHM